MKMIWKKTGASKKRSRSFNPELPFDKEAPPTTVKPLGRDDEIPCQKTNDEDTNTALHYEALGNELAEEGKFREALGKWETAITLTPERAVLHEQKAQVLLELGEAWNAVKAATRATELEPGWAEAWITLGRAQLNFGEPDCAIDSFDKGLAIKPNSVEAKDDQQAALHLVKRRQLHSSGCSSNERRFLVRDEV